ncbi:MAG: diguanylate cyclase [Solirubrobacterales bacterium]
MNANSDTHRSGGQAALDARMRIDHDIRNRSITGAVLWALQAAIGAIQQYGPAGQSITHEAFYAYLALTATMSLLCLFVGPLLKGRVFRAAEEFVVACGWLATTALVAATGGATSADIGLFANVMFYCAYFMPPSQMVRQVAVGSALMWAPLVYDFGSLAGTNFVARALVMTAVLWAMVVLIARNRHLTKTAELTARRLALTDPLTGVANLHTFTEELQTTVAAAERGRGRLGVAFVDVNGLKAANTVHGHAGGDQLIRRTAEALLSVSGLGDQVARVGGDEFAVLVPDADAARMKAFESDFALALSEQGAAIAGKAVELSASIGTATFPEDGRTLDELMEVADGRMYDSKAALPPRIPTPGTSGGRTLSDQPAESTSRIASLLTAGAPAASIAWLLAAALIGAGGSMVSGADVHPRLAFALAGICMAVAGTLALVGEGRRRRAENLSNALAVAIAIPAIYATGGAATPILPLAYLVVAHAAYALSARGAALRTAAMLAILMATLLYNMRTANFTGVSVIFGEVLVIAGLLRYNRVRAEAAERKALEISRTDALTRIANRRVFEHTLALTAARRPSSHPGGYDFGGLILADVDDFKAINSSGGHKAGDEVLRMIASVLEGAVGQDTVVCRIGGDEFAVIVPKGNSASLMRTAAKARAAIGAVDWHVLCEPEVTLSIGYATWEQVGEWKDIVVAADLAMRMSKDAGKDTVSTVQPRPGGSRASRAS